MIRLIFVVSFLLTWLNVRAGEKPNIVYIISDDQTWSDFGFMGNERVHTPNLDKLASEAATFVNGYLTTSVCRPSLVTLMTGLYPHQHGVHFNHGPPGNSAYNKMTSVREYLETREKEFELIQKVPTLPRVLAEQFGYRSLQTGKFWEGHWRNGGFTEGMTTFEAPPATQTYGGIRKLASGDLVAHGNGDSGLQIGRETMAPIKEFIVDCEKEKTPWLVWYAPYLPHQPHDSPERFYEIAKRQPGVKENEIPYFASIAQFDETVGELIDFVEGNTDVKNTIFVFVSDNGWSPSEKEMKKHPGEFEHTKASKRAPFDEGVRSPILIRWDGRVKPAVREDLVSSIDIVATLLAEVGARGVQLPGRNILEETLAEKPVFGEIYPGDAKRLGQPGREVAYRFVRDGDWKLIVPVGEKPWGGYLKSPALYEVSEDPAEKVNQINDPEGAAIAARLADLLDSWWKP
ncbi:MAG: sulfatase-like hydrolase/transferase [Verrucomicrobiales bacterium]|nr:sulfatase-like hydrolase/transferase [Verrucomicrobiales bacterium]